ncbi:hypothetical protein BO83DRAFT_126432 [Aspergillus eucalypticola CBS 122712]|uniref:Uncharacterized protein n=1 Tax=Aspergillus eucalypticola (strain CBS 122712 / IBT 29274) TaxID=1448314 RepID=A0A317UY15_ASPEC|nr:uncharacterized protein BO83DRAFT_126432 [Aspergillus eucalypticola CBS 122712]PWY64890.1 hypothetical protein BO83DRAFT_126432 [Aspergillus eucalypticola CBS 122712]
MRILPPYFLRNELIDFYYTSYATDVGTGDWTDACNSVRNQSRFQIKGLLPLGLLHGFCHSRSMESELVKNYFPSPLRPLSRPLKSLPIGVAVAADRHPAHQMLYSSAIVVGFPKYRFNSLRGLDPSRNRVVSQKKSTLQAEIGMSMSLVVHRASVSARIMQPSTHNLKSWMHVLLDRRQ